MADEIVQQDPQAIRRIAEESREHVLDQGLVIAVRDRFLDVQLDGSKKLVQNVVVPQHIDEVEVGWWVALVKLPRKTNWIALAALEDVSGGSRPTIANLPQPADVTATAKPYYIELSWSGSFRLEATYEIQHNSSAAEAGATLIKWEGSNFFYWAVPGTQRYFRVRAVSEDFERSSWSDWVDDTVPAGVEDMFLALDAALAPEWVAFDWDDVAAVAGADMVHDHSAAAEGGQLDWDDVWTDAVHDHSSNAEGGTHWGGITQTYGGGDGANIITIPDGLAKAVHIIDDGGVPVEFLTIDTLNNEIVFNLLELDVDVRFAGLAATNLFFFRGSDGLIAFGGPGAAIGSNWELRMTDNHASAMRFIDVGDANDYLTFVTTDGSREVVVNQDGHANIDFRVEWDTGTHALFVRGSDGWLGLGTAAPTERIHGYSTTAAIRMRLQTVGAGVTRMAGYFAETDDSVAFFAAYDDAYNVVPEFAGKSGQQAAGGALFLCAREATGEIQLYTGGRLAANRRVTVDAAGNTGIGSTLPQGKLHVGDQATNYSKFEADGTLAFVGAATVFDDLFFPMSTGKIGGVNQPTWAAFQGNTKEYTFAINDFIHLTSQEVAHSYKEGSDITLHVHIVLDGSDAGDTDVNYEVEYTMGDQDEVMSAAAVATSGDYTITGGTADRMHLRIEIGTIAGATYKMGSALKIRFRRIALVGAGNAPSNDPFALMVGAHIEEDTVGSRTVNTK